MDADAVPKRKYITYHVRVLRATNLWHQEVLGSEAHHHTETLTRCKNHGVLHITLQTCPSHERALECLGVAQARETSQLQHAGDIQDGREAHSDTEGRQEGVRRPNIARNVQVQARSQLLHANTCESTGECRSRGAERLLQMRAQRVLHRKIVRSEDTEAIEGDAREVRDDGSARSAAHLDLISAERGGIHDGRFLCLLKLQLFLNKYR
eukprot:1186401-Prorocentrum_minimum.AAC.4